MIHAVILVTKNCHHITESYITGCLEGSIKKLAVITFYLYS